MTIRHPFLFLGFVVIAAMLFQAACPEPSDAAVVPSAAGAYWDVSLTPDPDNVGLAVVTECSSGGRRAFRAVDDYDVAPGDARVLVRRAGPLPRQSECTVTFWIEVNRSHDGNPAHEGLGESARVSWKEP